MSQSFEINGTLKHLFDVQSFPSGFTKREFVIETTDDKYPQQIKFETVKDRTALLDDLAIGDALQVAFDIRGNEFKERFYVNLNAWKVTKADGSAAPEKQPQQSSANSSLEASLDNEPDESDDIPF